MTDTVRARPRVRLAPSYARSLGARAVELGRKCGLDADVWQKDVLDSGLGLDEEGKWSAFEVGVNVPRQNGKGSVLELRALLGLFELGEKLIIWSAQQGDTSLEAFYRLVALIEACPELDERVKEKRYASGRESIKLKTGERIRFMTRSKSRARGFSGDCVFFDEAMFLAEFSVAAMLPTLSARENPQVWYCGSAVDQQIHDEGIVWARVRERGVRGEPRLAYTEFSIDAAEPLALSEEQLHNQDLWAQANPALDVRISRDYVESEVRALDSRSFAVERLGVGDWPRTDFVSSSPISPEAWEALRDKTSVLEDPVCLAYDLSPERWGAIAAAGRNQRGDWHVEVVTHRQGMKWIVPRLVELQETHDVSRIVRAGHGPVASLTGQEEEEGLRPDLFDVAEHGAACGLLVDAVEEKTLRHLGSRELVDAVRGAATRPFGDAWAWSRKTSSVDISPLVAATLAFGAAVNEPEGGEFRVF